MTAAREFTGERLERLAEIEDRHFWFRGRRTLVRSLLERFAVNPPARVLDVGAGGGATSVLLARLGFRVTAADFLPAGLRAMRAADRGIRGVQCRAESLPFGSGCFDCVLLLDVLEHVDDEAALARVTPLLNGGGVLLVTVPAFPALWSYRDTAAGHRRRYRMQPFVTLLSRHGFRADYMNYYQFLTFPVTFLSRCLGRRNASMRDIEDTPPAWLNTLLDGITRAELALSARLRLPLGSSLVVAARKVR